MKCVHCGEWIDATHFEDDGTPVLAHISPDGRRALPYCTGRKTRLRPTLTAL